MSFLLTLMLAVSCIGIVSASAATEVIPVYLNDKAITFAANDAQPQLINSRTYVPVRATCDALGLTIDWNTKTETLTFTRDGITIAHTMRSKIVYVNGQSVDFDTPSINKNNRTLMPIRMLAESIGATVEWNNDTRSVHITTAGSVSDNTATAAAPKVTSLALSSSSVESGAKVVISAVASADTDRVSFRNDATGEVFEEVSEYSVNSDNTRTFESAYKFVNDTSGDQAVIVKALPAKTGGEFVTDGDSTKSTPIIIKPASSSSSNDSDDDNSSVGSVDNSSDHIEKVTLSSKSVAKNKYVTFTVRTDTEISKIKVTNSFGTDDVIVSDYEKDEDNDTREFTAKLKMTKTGTQTVKLYAYVKGDGYEDDYASVNIKVTSDDDDDDTSSTDEPEIIDLDLTNDTVYKDMDAHLNITTNSAVKKIYIKDDSDSTVTSTAFYSSKSNGKIYWNIDFTVSQTGKKTYTVEAYDDDDNYADDTVKVNGKSWSSRDPLVLDVVQETTDITEGDDVKFKVVCTQATSYATITRGTSNEVGTAKSGSKSGDTRVFYITFEMQNINSEYYAHAYSESGSSGNDYSITLTGDVYEEISVKDVSLDSSTVKEDEDINVSVLTSASASKVWIEDDRGNRVSKVYKTPSDEDGDDLVWEINFSPTETGRNTYTAVAQDDNNKKESRDFRVTVR